MRKPDRGYAGHLERALADLTVSLDVRLSRSNHCPPQNAKPGNLLAAKTFSPALLVEKVKEVRAPVNNSPAAAPEFFDDQSPKAGFVKCRI